MSGHGCSHIRHARAMLATLTLLSVNTAHAQTTTQTKTDTGSMPGMQVHTMPMPDSPMKTVLDIPMNRAGSGTAWVPDAVALPTRHATLGEWSTMLHGFAFAGVNAQRGPRGDTQFGSMNWGMVMASRPLAGGVLELRGMGSLDVVSVGNRGYPLLLQTGETYDGETLHDRQHPHDVFMELSVGYTRAITSSLAFQLYLAPSGEPAIGTNAFMHRPSGMDDPAAPIGHHWQDATHVSFGVATVGIFSQWFKLEGSVFNAREPDENRWNVELNALNSYSGRLSANPSANWSVSAGLGVLNNAEPGSEGAIHRRTVAVQHGRKTARGGQWATTLMWSANASSMPHPILLNGSSNVRAVARPDPLLVPLVAISQRNTIAASTSATALSQSMLAESEWVIDARNSVFARAELVEKSLDDLALPDMLGASENGTFRVGHTSLGYVRELASGRSMSVGIGARGTVNFVPLALEPIYGSRTPLGALVFLRLRAANATTAMDHSNMR